MRAALVLALLFAAGVARAQPSDPSGPPPGDDPTLTPVQSCGSEPAPTAEDQGIPQTWKDYDLEGHLSDPESTVRALLDPTLQGAHALTQSARADIRRAARAFGYYVVGMATRDTAAGVHLVIHIEPLPLIRHIDITVEHLWFDTQYEDELRRRMRLRIGGTLPWAPDSRACEIVDEQKRLEEYLADEGFFDARVHIDAAVDGASIRLKVHAHLGAGYHLDIGAIRVAKAPGNLAPALTDDEVRRLFRTDTRLCRWTDADYFCVRRFTLAQHKIDLKKVVAAFQDKGFPSVRVTDDFDATTKTSFDRASKTVGFTLAIDQRRKLDVGFEGNDKASVRDDDLKKQLTFNAGGSADDVEAGNSAKAITAYLQGRGLFDAKVTWTRERFAELDHVIYRIDQGGHRRVAGVAFTGNTAIDDDALTKAVATKRETLSTTLLGTIVNATSPQLADDIDRITALYADRGYRDTRVAVFASTDPGALNGPAAAAALLGAGRGDGVLYVRFAIAEGQPTLLSQVRVELGTRGDAIASPDDRAVCTESLRALADILGDKNFATPLPGDRCVATAPKFHYRADAVDAIKDTLRERLWNLGRPRARVDLTVRAIAPYRTEAVFRVANSEHLKMGKAVVRGNFRTKESIVLGELGFVEGQPLTADALAEAARRLRQTGLFDAVNIDLPDLDRTSAGEVNAIVRLEERYDERLIVDTEVGYSSYSGAFTRVTPSFKNLFGRGISLDLSGTLGFDPGLLLDDAELKLKQLNAEASLKFPGFLVRQTIGFAVQTELTAFRRLQDTPRFGPLTTEGFTLTGQHTWRWDRGKDRVARLVTLGGHYDFRLRERQADVTRPEGADDDQPQVPISTLTGSVGLTLEWEQRTDRNGNLSPLAPEAGYRWDVQASFASPYLFGQDTFFKISAGGSRYFPLTDNLVLRTDFRYDQGFPIGKGVVLLPEVERYFAGGDSTVRGYNDDRMATEIVKVAVPPLANVEQIRILPAGGNIRVMGSLDAQLRIYKILATALFVDAGMITNAWQTADPDEIRPSIGMALVRFVTPVGSLAFERAIPLRPQLGDDPRGRWHISFAARAQF